MGTMHGAPLKSGGVGMAPRGTFVAGGPGGIVQEPIAAPIGTFVGGQPPGTQMVAPAGTHFTGGGIPTGFGGPLPTGAVQSPAYRGGILKAGSITDDVFNMVDSNHDGVISRSEFRGALKGNII